MCVRNNDDVNCQWHTFTWWWLFFLYCKVLAHHVTSLIARRRAPCHTARRSSWKVSVRCTGKWHASYRYPKKWSCKENVSSVPLTMLSEYFFFFLSLVTSAQRFPVRGEEREAHLLFNLIIGYLHLERAYIFYDLELSDCPSPPFFFAFCGMRDESSTRPKREMRFKWGEVRSLDQTYGSKEKEENKEQTSAPTHTHRVRGWKSASELSWVSDPVDLIHCTHTLMRENNERKYLSLLWLQ